MRTAIIWLLFCTTAYGGIDFAMAVYSAKDVPKEFSCKEDAEAFGQLHRGNTAVVQELKSRIDGNIKRLAEILDYDDDETLGGKIRRMDKAAELAKLNEYYRIILKIVDTGVGATVYAGSQVVL